MFRVILATQWKWSKGALLLATIASFAIPVLSIRDSWQGFQALDARNVLSTMQSWGAWYAAVAAATGLAVAMLAWGSDHAGRHVYALSLPIERWRYVALRFGAGALLLMAPIVALLVGAHVSIGMSSLPPGLHAYPTALAIRFAMAALLAYGLFFAVSSATPRTAGVVTTLIIGAAVVSMGLEEMARMIGSSSSSNLLNFLLDWPGLLHPFTGRWMLIDV
jgi:hypothetical protein